MKVKSQPDVWFFFFFFVDREAGASEKASNSSAKWHITERVSMCGYV